MDAKSNAILKAYTTKKRCIERQLVDLNHAVQRIETAGPIDWGDVSTLGHVQESLAELLSFLGNTDE